MVFVAQEGNEAWNIAVMRIDRRYFEYCYLRILNGLNGEFGLFASWYPLLVDINHTSLPSRWIVIDSYHMFVIYQRL